MYISGKPQVVNQKLTESHLLRQYLDIALIPVKYLDIALVAVQYKIYCPALAFDLPKQGVTYKYTKPNKNLWSHQSIMLDFIKIAHSNEPITIQHAIDEMCIHACAYT